MSNGIIPAPYLAEQEVQDMKRLCCLWLCVLMLVPLIPSLAGGITPVMRVVKCSEWVSLRALPATTSDRLAKVYLGELVTGCSADANGFVLCTYSGKTGYILDGYLETTDFAYYSEVLPNQMVVNCTEWVSMRSGPYEGAARIRTVPLGAIVMACVRENENYIACEYQGKRGYILSSYLKKANYSASKQDENVVSRAAGKYPAISGPMTVVNCTEWVSLREKASSGSARLARVPLGEKVTDCVQVDEQFIYCHYRELWGYIDIRYLQAQGAGGTPFDQLSAAPGYAEFSAAGDEELSFSTGGDHGINVAVRRAYAGDTEALCAAFYDADWGYLGRLTASANVSELAALQAFAAGTENDRTLLWLTKDSISCYGAASAGMALRWTLSRDASCWWAVGGSACFAEDDEGNIYLCGYYDDAPVCISSTGVPLWRAQTEDPMIYWPYQIDPVAGGIRVSYARGGPGENGTALTFGRDGSLVSQGIGTDYILLREGEDGETTDHAFSVEGEESELIRVIITCTAPGGLENFQILALEVSFREGSDDWETIATPTASLGRIEEGETVGAYLSFDGAFVQNGVSFLDRDGALHRYIIDLSGEDGSLLLKEF